VGSNGNGKVCVRIHETVIESSKLTCIADPNTPICARESARGIRLARPHRATVSILSRWHDQLTRYRTTTWSSPYGKVRLHVFASLQYLLHTLMHANVNATPWKVDKYAQEVCTDEWSTHVSRGSKANARLPKVTVAACMTGCHLWNMPRSTVSCMKHHEETQARVYRLPQDQSDARVKADMCSSCAKRVSRHATPEQSAAHHVCDLDGGARAERVRSV